MRSVSAEIEAEERARVCRIAREFSGTPYHPNARVKGPHGGVDCLTIIVGTYEEAELIPRQELPTYSATWHLHQYEEKYLEAITRFCRELPDCERPKPGDLAVYKMGKCFSHAVIVLNWPHEVIHAYFGRNVFVTDASNDSDLIGKPRKYFSFWE